MIIKDVKKEFFSVLRGRILIMCALDVDAICSCKILQYLLETFNLQYTVAPVTFLDDLCRSFEEYRNSSDTVIFINFGNSINIPKVLKPPESLNFYVIDSHRPINVHNFYKNSQVKILINKNEKELNIPQKNKIFLDKDHSNQDDDDDEENLALLTVDASELTNEQLEKRRELREWLIQKQRVMFDYEEFHYFSRPVSLIMYELACQIGKYNNYLLWLGIVGLTYLFKANKITQEAFDEEVERVLRYIARNQVSTNHARGNGWTIRLQDDIALDLYRTRKVYDSLWHTPLTVCRFQLWNDKGLGNLLEFLVECGLPLVQCQTSFETMELQFKSNMFEYFQNACLGDRQFKYNLQELITKEFVMKCDIKVKFSATDVAFGVRALLDIHDRRSTRNERFVRAMQSISDEDLLFRLLKEGIELAHLQSKSKFEQVKFVINNQKVVDDGVFLHLDLQDLSNITQDFARGDSLVSFARFLLEAYVSSKTTRVARRLVRLPLILLCPDFSDQSQTLIVGVPPVAQESKKNFFGKAFEQASANIECEIMADLSETNLIRIHTDYKDALLEQMRHLLE